MKNLIVLCFLSFSCITFSQAQNQTLLLKVHGKSHFLTEFETSVLGVGVGLEGQLGRLLSVGLNVGYGKNDIYHLTHASPSLRFYPLKDMKGPFIGIGLEMLHMKSIDSEAIGYPLDDEDAPQALVGGPIAVLGVQTVVRSTVSIGFQFGLGYMPTAEAAIVQGQFSIGLKL